MSADLNPKGVVAYGVATQLAVRCGTCSYFDADCRRCVIVAGEIDADCTCALFVQRRPMRSIGSGVPGSVATIPVLDIPTLGRMDLMPTYSDVMRGFVTKAADGSLALNCADPPPKDDTFAALATEARKALGLAANTKVVVNTGNATGTPVLDALLGSDTLRLVPHAPYSVEFAVAKQDDSLRYTLGPLYMPDTLDAHSEFVDGPTLQNAAWDYVRSAVANGSNIIFDQHTDSPAGEWVELMTWPYEHTTEVLIPGEGLVQRTFPAGTVYQGVVWNDTVWKQVLNGEKRGLSMGGSAIREPVTVAQA